MEYLVVCMALAVALGLAYWNDGSVLKELVEAFQLAYRKIAFSISIPI